MSMPWSPRTRPQDGMKTEKDIVKKRGGRVHPRSGAGNIKDDGSTATEVFEVKDADKTHVLKASQLFAIWRRAVRQGKEAKYIVYFRSVDLTATITFQKGKQ